MKKTLLSLGLAAFALAASAQSSLVLYSGNKTTDFLNSDGYSFDAPSPKFIDSLLSGTTSKFIYLSGSTTGYYIGGFGQSSYPKAAFSTKFTGDFTTSSLGFSAFTEGTTPALKIQLLSATGKWGYVFDLATASTTLTPFTTTLGSFKTIVGNDPTGAPMTSTDFADVNEIQFVLNYNANGGKGTGTLQLDNIVIADASALAIEENFLSSNKDEVVSVYDMMGAFVATGKLASLNLEAGKMYVVKAGNKSRKIVMN